MFESFLGVNPWTSLFILLNTLTIYFVAKHYLFQPVLTFVEERQQEIEDLYTEANAAREQAAALETACKEKLSNAMDTSANMIKEAVSRGQAQEEDILRKANAEAAARLERASADILREKQKAIHEAKDAIASLAITIAEKVTAKEIRSADQARLIDSFIQGLGDPG